jgi:hypothetical protein
VEPPSTSDILGFRVGRTCDGIKTIVQNLFAEPYKTENEIAKKFSIIKILIKFAERYSQLDDDVKAWKFTMIHLPTVFLNETFDYLRFFSIYYGTFMKPRGSFPEYKESDSPYFFLLAIVITHIIRTKDSNLFKVDHPELPYFAGLVIYNTDFFGFPKHYYHPCYYNYLEDHFSPETKIKFLNNFLTKREQTMNLVKKGLGIEINDPIAISDLLEKLKATPNKPQIENYNDLLWILSGVACIKEFLGDGKLANRHATMKPDSIF